VALGMRLGYLVGSGEIPLDTSRTEPMKLSRATWRDLWVMGCLLVFASTLLVDPHGFLWWIGIGFGWLPPAIEAASGVWRYRRRLRTFA